MGDASRASRIRRGGASGIDGPPTRLGDEAGEIAATVVVSGFFLTIVALVIQVGIWMHAGHVALAAADNGDQAARSYGSSPQAGAAAAQAFLDRLGAGVLSDVSVTSSIGAGDTAVVTVTGEAESLIPGFHHRVSETSVGAIQEFRASG